MELISYSEVYDLALLQIRDSEASNSARSYRVDYCEDFQYRYDQKVEMYGYPWGWTQRHRLCGELTVDSLVASIRIRNNAQLDLFTDSIPVITLQAEIFSGMSGAPVYIDGRIVGVLSGSLSEGGSIAWAIPIGNVQRMKTVHTSPDSFDWPPLTLMNKSNWRSMQFEGKMPRGDFSVRVGGMSNPFKPKDEAYGYLAYISVFADDYAHGLAYGFDVGSYSRRYAQTFETFLGTTQENPVEDSLNPFVNLFLLKKHYSLWKRPYYGLGAGIPLNAQLVVGSELFWRCGLEARCIYYTYTEKEVHFSYYGDSKIVDKESDEFKFYIGISADIKTGWSIR